MVSPSNAYFDTRSPTAPYNEQSEAQQWEYGSSPDLAPGDVLNEATIQTYLQPYIPQLVRQNLRVEVAGEMQGLWTEEEGLLQLQAKTCGEFARAMFANCMSVRRFAVAVELQLACRGFLARKNLWDSYMV